MDLYPQLWEFKETVPARLVWDGDESAVVLAGGKCNEVMGCVISLNGKLCERYNCRGLKKDEIRELLLTLAPVTTHQVGHMGVLVYHFKDVVSMRIGERKTLFKFNSLQILYDGYSEVLMHSDALYRKDVGAVSHAVAGAL